MLRSLGVTFFSPVDSNRWTAFAWPWIYHRLTYTNQYQLNNFISWCWLIDSFIHDSSVFPLPHNMVNKDLFRALWSFLRPLCTATRRLFLHIHVACVMSRHVHKINHPWRKTCNLACTKKFQNFIFKQMTKKPKNVQMILHCFEKSALHAIRLKHNKNKDFTQTRSIDFTDLTECSWCC